MLLLSGVVVAVAAGFGRGVWVENLHNGLLACSRSRAWACTCCANSRETGAAARLWATGVVEALMFLGRQIGHDPGPGTSPWWGWLGGLRASVVGLALVTLSVILFPDGDLPSPGWRWRSSASAPS